MNQQIIDNKLNPLDKQNCIDGKVQIWKLFNVNGEDIHYCTMPEKFCEYQKGQPIISKGKGYYPCNKFLLK